MCFFEKAIFWGSNFEGATFENILINASAGDWYE